MKPFRPGKTSLAVMLTILMAGAEPMTGFGSMEVAIQPLPVNHFPGFEMDKIDLRISGSSLEDIKMDFESTSKEPSEELAVFERRSKKDGYGYALFFSGINGALEMTRNQEKDCVNAQAQALMREGQINLYGNTMVLAGKENQGMSITITAV